MNTSRLGCFVKRALDLAIAVPSLVVLSPVLTGISLAIYLDAGRPVVLVQGRIGHRRRPFRLYKFRSMKQDASQRTAATGEAVVSSDDDRLTRTGRLLRETGLDELPQLWNVIRGDMSLVGPRPYMATQANLVPSWAARRWDVKPGVVCLAEVTGRNALAWETRLTRDVAYVETASIWTDIKIIAAAIPTALGGRGVYAARQDRDPDSPLKPAE